MNSSLSNIVFMKCGVHASESINSIVRRKVEEINKCHIMFWGYGGVICHPLSQVQPFAQENTLNGQKTYLLLSETPSKLNNQPSLAMHYSVDRNIWKNIPNGIQVFGSKYAIVCGEIEQCDFTLDLSKYIIPTGTSKGKLLSEYVKGRVDKACGRYKNLLPVSNPSLVKISLCAEIIEPYSVFVE